MTVKPASEIWVAKSCAKSGKARACPAARVARDRSPEALCGKEIAMSRIGKKPVDVLDGVNVSVDGSMITVEGPKGKLQYECRPEVEVASR